MVEEGGASCLMDTNITFVFFSSHFSIYKSSLVVESGVKHHNPMPIPLYWDYLLTGLNHLGSRIPMA
jgi:hypothetical protein